MPDEEWGNRVVAFVVGPLSLEAARDWVAEARPAVVGAPAAGRARRDPDARQRQARPRPCDWLAGARVTVWSVPMRTRFRGITVREGMLLRGEAGWGEWSPFLEYDAAEAEPWLRCAEEAAAGDWPAPRARLRGGQRDRARGRPGAGGGDRAPRRLPYRQGEGGRARPDPRRRPGPGRGGARRARSGRRSAGRRQRRLVGRRRGPRDRAAGPSGRWPGVRRAAVRDRRGARRRYAGRSTYRSRPTSRSGGPPTPTGCATWRRPTSRC